MLYLSEKDILKIGIDWVKVICVIEESVKLLERQECSQPIKPYLRFKNLENRIIAMPAYVGGDFDIAGIKWISSFPGNRDSGLPRAHSILVLNHAQTGQPISIINTPLLSGIRTAAVTGLLVQKYLNRADAKKKLNFGIIGFGPIGQLHMRMLLDIFKDRINTIMFYDLKGIDNATIAGFPDNHKIQQVNSWLDVYHGSDILITCTVSKDRYINIPPIKGKLYLNISLRDFDVAFLKAVDLIIVDDWEEVCRENTDIECAHKSFGLTANDVLSIPDVLRNDWLNDAEQSSVMFNPMGMGIFDIAIAKYYNQVASELGVGNYLD